MKETIAVLYSFIYKSTCKLSGHFILIECFIMCLCTKVLLCKVNHEQNQSSFTALNFSTCCVYEDDVQGRLMTCFKLQLNLWGGGGGTRYLNFMYHLARRVFSCFFFLQRVIVFCDFEREGVLHGSTVECFTCYLWVRAALDPLGFFVGVSLGKHFRAPAYYC